MLNQPFREMLRLLSGEGSPQGAVPPDVVEAARQAEGKENPPTLILLR